MPEKTTVTDEVEVVSWKIALPAAALLAIIGGVVFGSQGPDLVGSGNAVPDDATAQAAMLARESVNEMAEWSLTVAGILLGAGLGLLLLDFKKTRTTVTETTTTGEVTNLGTGELLKESLGLVKDLTPGKTLLVLGVALLGVSLLAVTPPDGSEVTVQTAASARR